MSFSVELEDANAPFLCPNQYVNFTPESQVVAVAAELCQGLETGAEKLAAVRAYIQENICTITSRRSPTTPGQMPDIEGCMESRMGNCQGFGGDGGGMLRSQGVPVEFVVGYAGNVYHAWTVVLLEEGNVLYDPRWMSTALPRERYTPQNVFIEGKKTPKIPTGARPRADFEGKG